MADNAAYTMPEGFKEVVLPPGFTEMKARPGDGAKELTQDDHGIIVGGLLDTFGLSDRPGAVPLTGNATTKTPLGVVLKPGTGPRMGLGETLDPLIEHGTSMAVTNLPTMKAGQLAGRAAAAAPRLIRALAPAAGRVATQGAISKARGDSTSGAFLDMAGAAIGEGAMAGAGKIAGKLAAPAKRAAEAADVGKRIGDVLPELAVDTDKQLWGAAQQWGREMVDKAFRPTVDELKARLPRAMLNVPTLSGKPVSVGGAIEGLLEADRATRGAIRREVIAALESTQKGAGALLDDALKARAAGYTYLTALKKSMDPSGNLDPRKLAAYVNKNYETLQRYAGKYWPQVEAALLGPGKSAPVELPAARAKVPFTHRDMPELSRGAARKAGAFEQAAQKSSAAGVGSTLGAKRDPVTNVPAGVLGAAGAVSMLPAFARHVPGVRLIEQIAEEGAE